MPSLPIDPNASFAALPLPARVFGTCIEDLDIDFNTSDRVALAIRVVAQTLESEGGSGSAGERARALPLGVRILQLLQLVADLEDEGALTIASHCPAGGCGEAIELSLPLSGLIEYGAAPLLNNPYLEWGSGGDGEPLVLRRATGQDQQVWQQRSYADRADAGKHLLASLVASGRKRLNKLTANEREEIARSMAEIDPLVGFRIDTRCPHCENEVILPMDLERACLGRLHQRQLQILEAIHTLASAYGWTEETILRLSPARRRFYLDRIDREDRVERR